MVYTMSNELVSEERKTAKDFLGYNRQEKSQKRKKIVHNSLCEARGLTIYTCTCGNQDVRSMYGSIQELCKECSEIEWQKALEARRQERMTEQFPNEFGIVKTWRKDTTWYKIDGKNEFDIECYEQTYVTPCGNERQVEHYTVNMFAEEHDCLACKVLLGKSKARIMTQQQVANLFVKGIDGKESHKGNLTSRNGQLTHYSTIEAIRLKDGTIIDNTQCWSAGFASCPSVNYDHSLPLSTISRIVGRFGTSLSESLKIIDTDGSSVLFSIEETRQILYGYDDDHFLVELPKKVNTVKAAYESLAPELARDNPDVKRQGDLFFIPIDSNEVKNPVKTEFVKSCKVPYDGIGRDIHFEWDTPEYEEHKKFMSKIDAMNTLAKNLREIEWRKENPDKEVNKVFVQDLLKMQLQITLDYYKLLKVDKHLETPQIFKTNHTAQELADFLGYIVVKGKIRHTRRQHSVLDLGNKWHIVQQNLGVNSWQVPSREGWGGGGGD